MVRIHLNFISSSRNSNSRSIDSDRRKFASVVAKFVYTVLLVASMPLGVAASCLSGATTYYVSDT